MEICLSLTKDEGRKTAIVRPSSFVACPEHRRRVRRNTILDRNYGDQCSFDLDKYILSPYYAYTVYSIPYIIYSEVSGKMLKPDFVPLRANLGQQVYQYLIDKIYKMEIEPGTQLGIGEMADQLGVSRSPVRDAFLRLLAEGVLELLPSGGYRVIQFTH